VRALLLLIVLGACGAGAPSYQAATSHYRIATREYAVDVELGKSDDLGAASRYIAQRAGELCSDGYDIESTENFDFRDHYPASEETCLNRRTCFGGGRAYGNANHLVHAVVVCRWHGL
jgi:hypothetical protein